MLGPALARAIASLREELGDPTAPIAIVTPSSVNGTFVRRELALTTNFIRVETWTPAELESMLAEGGLRRSGLVVEPPGWLRAIVTRVVQKEELPGGYHDVLREPGWTAALESALRALEGGRVSARTLASLALPEGLKERAEALGHLLRRVSEARVREGIAGPGEVADAALAAAREGTAGPANVARGAILVGDARLSKTTFEVLEAWLVRRPVVRIDLAELASLPAERHGLTSAAPHARAVALPARAPEIALVRTPDPTRELAEAVRVAQSAIVRGVPLDRIAIVLPDPSEASSLSDALARASIPATWMTGPPLATTPAARFLMHAIELALGEQNAENTVVRWYDLLRQSELRLRAVLGEAGSRGRGRWRRLLSQSGAIRGTARIVREVERLRSEGPEDERPEAKEARIAAIDALVLAMRTLASELEALVATRTVGAHARALRAFLRRWWAPSPDQQILAGLLESWGRSPRGPEVDLAEMMATLEEALESTETLSGSLKDAAIRVLSPMQLLGAELDVVLVTGMTEGRFPARPREDPLLADAIVDAIDRVAVSSLFRSGDRVLLERRRLAAVRSAATGHLWLSAPATEMLEGRPLLPGSLLLEVASAQAGQRVGPSELAARMQVVGRRSRSWPQDPEVALGALEHLLSRLHRAGPAHDTDRAAALSALVDHTLARRLVLAAWAQGRLARGEHDDSLRAHAGFVPPETLACRGLDGAPLTPRELAGLIESPETFFLEYVLGAWPAPRLRDGWDPIAQWWVDATLLKESRTVLERAEQLRERFGEAFATRVTEELERTGVGDDDAPARLSRMAARTVDALLGTEPAAGPIHALEAAPLEDDLPWRLRGGDARALGASLHWVVKKIALKKTPPRAELLEALARASTRRFTSMELRDLRGEQTRFEDALPAHLERARHELRVATALARAGYYPVEGVSAPPEALRAWGIEIPSSPSDGAMGGDA
ncbi:MAG: hypothetical protein OHK0013_03470 [Sandaracinaceae bacterium]